MRALGEGFEKCFFNDFLWVTLNYRVIRNSRRKIIILKTHCKIVNYKEMTILLNSKRRDKFFFQFSNLNTIITKNNRESDTSESNLDHNYVIFPNEVRWQTSHVYFCPGKDRKSQKYLFLYISHEIPREYN